MHKQRGTKEDGTAWEKIRSWFGYTLNLMVDTRYELPVGFSLTKANSSEEGVSPSSAGSGPGAASGCSPAV